MKIIKGCFAVLAWFAATIVLTEMIIDCMEWEVQQRVAAAAEYRRQMAQELRVEYAVYEVE